MPSVRDLLQSPSLKGLRDVADAGSARSVRSVAFIEHLSEVEGVPAESLVVLSRHGSAAITDYQLDVALRWIAIRQAAGLAVVTDELWRPSVTALEIARREAIALLRALAGTDLAQLMQTLANEIHGDASLALERADAAMAAIMSADAHGLEPSRVAELMAGALGTEIFYLADAGAERPPGRTAAVIVAGQVQGWLTSEAADGVLGVAVGLVLHVAAAAAARYLEAAARSREIPIRSRSELLSGLLMADSGRSEDLVTAARSAGLPVDGWHVAVHMQLAWPEIGQPEIDMTSFEVVDSAARVALQRFASAGGTWAFTRFARTVLLVSMTGSDPGPLAGGRIAKVAGLAVAAIEDRFPGVKAGAGIGAAHEGLLGLRASVTEARAILASARAAGRTEPVVTFDGAGIHRMLVEWYTTLFRSAP